MYMRRYNDGPIDFIKNKVAALGERAKEALIKFKNEFGNMTVVQKACYIIAKIIKVTTVIKTLSESADIVRYLIYLKKLSDQLSNVNEFAKAQVDNEIENARFLLLLNVLSKSFRWTVAQVLEAFSHAPRVHTRDSYPMAMRRHSDGISDVASKLRQKVVEYIDYLKTLPTARACVTVLGKVLKVVSLISVGANSAALAKGLVQLKALKPLLEKTFVVETFDRPFGRRALPEQGFNHPYAAPEWEFIPTTDLYSKGKKELWLKAGKRIIIGLIGALIGYLTETLAAGKR